MHSAIKGIACNVFIFAKENYNINVFYTTFLLGVKQTRHSHNARCFRKQDTSSLLGFVCTGSKNKIN